MFKAVLTTMAAAALCVGPAHARSKPLEAVASFSVLADMVRQVGGVQVHVVSLVPPNGDPHDFEPKPQDAKLLKSADVVFTSGLGLEVWLNRLAKAAGYAGTPVVASKGIAPRTLEEDGKSIPDPHAWNSIANAEVYVRNIADALAKADPDDAAVFQKNADAYDAKLKALDGYARAEIGAVPAAERKVLTTHDALGYFGDAYGVTFVSPLGLSTDTEPSAAQVAAVIRQIKAEHVGSYFFENSNDPRLVKQIAVATGARPGGELFVESLSPPGGPASTYLDMFKSNVDKLVAGMKAAPKS